MPRQQQHYCFDKNKIRITSRSFLTLKQESSLFLLLSLGHSNFFWYHDFLGRWEKLSWKMKNILYFLNHDTLIWTLHWVPNCYLSENWNNKIWSQNLSRVSVLWWRVIVGFKFQIEDAQNSISYESCYSSLQAS